jgi:hypothetical protein
MDYLRRMQSERPVLFFAAMLLVFWVGFRLVMFIAELVLGPLGLPSWVPIVVVLGILVVVARRQQR